MFETCGKLRHARSPAPQSLLRLSGSLDIRHQPLPGGARQIPPPPALACLRTAAFDASRPMAVQS